MKATPPKPLDLLWEAITDPPNPPPDPFKTDDVLHWMTAADSRTSRWWATRLNDGRWVDDLGNIDTHADLVGMLKHQHRAGKLRFLAHYPAAASTVAIDQRS